MDFINVFAVVDRDQDLVVHKADLDWYAEEKQSKGFTRKWLTLFDDDDDGKFTFSEFCQSLGVDEKFHLEKLLEIRKDIKPLDQQQQQQQQQVGVRDSRKQIAEELKREMNKEIKEYIKEDEAKEEIKVEGIAMKVEEKITEDGKEEAKVEIKVQIREEEKENERPPRRQYLVREPGSTKVEIDEATVKSQPALKIKEDVPQKIAKRSSMDELELEIYKQSLQVEFFDMDSKDLEEIKQILVRVSRRAKTSSSSKEFDKEMMRELDRKLGKTWQCQTNPVLNPKEVNYLEGNMAVMVDKDEKRVMVWKSQPSGGLCCCS